MLFSFEIQLSVRLETVKLPGIDDNAKMLPDTISLMQILGRRLSLRIIRNWAWFKACAGLTKG